MLRKVKRACVPAFEKDKKPLPDYPEGVNICRNVTKKQAEKVNF